MLKTRIITALILAGGLLAALFQLPSVVTQMLFIGIVAVAAWEWAGLLRVAAPGRWLFGLITSLPCAALAVGGLPQAWLLGLWSLALIFWVVLVPVWFRHKWAVRPNLGGFLIGWVLLIPSWAAMTMLYLRSPWLLLAAMALVWVADIAAYFAGRTFGRRKLAPAISPGKTWEGAAGAVIGVLLYGLAVASGTGRLASLTVSQLILAMLGLMALTAVSILGDLFESLVKRQAGLKDSSNLLPGHGGVLDRIDSLTSTLPMVGLISLLIF